MNVIHEWWNDKLDHIAVHNSENSHVIGFLGKALRIQQRLLQRFPDDVLLRNKMGVTFLLMNQGSAAKEVFETVLQKWPDDGFAQVGGDLMLHC